MIILKYEKLEFLQLTTQNVNVPFYRNLVTYLKFSSGFSLRCESSRITYVKSQLPDSESNWRNTLFTDSCCQKQLSFSFFVFLSPIAPGIHHWPKWQVGRGTSRLGRVCYWPEWQQTSLQGATLLWGGSGGLPHRYCTLKWQCLCSYGWNECF